MIYLAILLLLIFLVYRYDYCNIQTGRKTFVWIVLSLFVLVAGLRFRLGADTVTYMYFYDIISPIDHLKPYDFDKTRFAPGFVILMSFFKFFFTDFTPFQFFHALVVCGTIFYFFYKNCKHFFFCVLIFYFFLYTLLIFQQMRESLAVSVFLMMWPYFKEGKWLQWYLGSLIAISFHISAIMLFVLPLFCLPGIRQLFVFGFRTWFICILIFLIGLIIQRSFFKYIELIAITESMTDRSEVYSKTELSGTIVNAMGVVGTIMKYILYPVLALYFMQIYNKKLRGIFDVSFDKYIMMALMSVYVAIFSICVAITSRYNNYFFVFSIVIIGDWAFTRLIMMRKEIRLKYCYWLLLFLPMFAFQVHSAYLAGYNKSGTLKGYMLYYPYSSCFDMSIDKDREACYNYRRVKGR